MQFAALRWNVSKYIYCSIILTVSIYKNNFELIVLFDYFFFMLLSHSSTVLDIGGKHFTCQLL